MYKVQEVEVKSTTLKALRHCPFELQNASGINFLDVFVVIMEAGINKRRKAMKEREIYELCRLDAIPVFRTLCQHVNA